MLTRRTFLTALGLGSAAAVVAPELLVPEPEPVRRYWQVGTDLRPATVSNLNGLYKEIMGRGPDLGSAPLIVSRETYESLESDALWLSADHGFTYYPPEALTLLRVPADFERHMEAHRREFARLASLNDVVRGKAEAYFRDLGTFGRPIGGES